MKISKSTPSSGKTTEVGSGRSARTGGSAPTAPTSPPQDDVQITSLSAQLKALESRLADTEVVDVARVQAIRDAIAEGRFRINPEVIADRLLETARELVGGRKA